MDIFNYLDRSFFEIIKNLFGIDDIDTLPKIKSKRSTISKYKQCNVIVSLTSHPPRINTAWMAIMSIYKQTQLPSRVVLNLASEDFPKGIDSLPNTLKYLHLHKGLEIVFTENYKVATKLIPTLKRFQRDTIITIDDDRIYNENFIKLLWEEHLKYPKDIISTSARKYIFVEGKCYGRPDLGTNPKIDYLLQSYLYNTCDFGIFEGFAGVLYPAESLDREVFNFNNFKVLTPFADDIWFQAMAIKNNTKVRGLSHDILSRFEDLKWPKEIDGTQKTGLYHRHLKANNIMCYRTLYYYDLLDKLGIPKIKRGFTCEGCKRKIKLYKPNEKLSVKTEGQIKPCCVCLNSHRKKVLCIGNYDYGNIGDEVYKLVIDKYLDSSFKRVFISDTFRVNKDKKYIEMNSKEEDYDFDILIIGGGGIIKDYNPIKNSIGYYIERAISMKKPYFFVSCGLQTSISDPSIDQVKNILGDNMERYLHSASYIWVRSIKDLMLLNQAVSDIYHKIDALPDLGYLYPKMVGVETVSKKNKKYITLLQTGSASVENEYVRDLLRCKPEKELIVINMGGSENPEKSQDYKEFNLFSQKVKEYFPKAKVFMGDSISPELKNLRYSKDKTRESDITSEKVVEYISKSHMVITGRYHGYVFAKSLGIDTEAPISTYKINAEKHNYNISESCDPSFQLENIKNFVNNNGGCVTDFPQKWDEDTRNTHIVQVNSEHNLPIQHVQSMDNNTIWKMLTGIKRSY